MSSFTPKALFKIFENDVCVLSYDFDSKEKAVNWAKEYINDMKKIGCWPIKGIKVKVESLA